MERVCKRCLIKDEDEIHCFLKCPVSKKVWDILIPGNSFVSNALPFHSWLEHQILNGSSRHRKLIFTALYSIWLARNKSIFENVMVLPQYVAQTTISRLDELGSVNISIPRRTATATAITSWSPPSPPFVKMNFDAGFDEQFQQGIGGIVARNPHRKVLVAGCFAFGNCFDAKHAESRAAQPAMDIAVMLGYNSVIFEGDCKVLIDEINRRKRGEAVQDCSEVEDVISGFLLGSTALVQWSAAFTKRNNNSLAHHLASRRKTLDSDVVYFHPIPVWLETLASCDVILPDIPS